MAALTISEAARLCGVNRRTLQRAIQAGRLLLTVEHLVDIADLRRAGYSVPVSQLDTAPTPHDAAPAAHEAHAARYAAATPQDTPQELPLVTALLAHLEQLTRTIVALHQEVILLREDLRQTPQRRRSFAPHDVRHTAGEPQGGASPVPHHDALTPQDAPHHVTPVAAVPQGDAAPVPHHTTLTPQDTAPVATVPQGSEARRGMTEVIPPSAAKRRGRPPVLRPGILALLDAHPDGLTATELKVYLGTEKHIGDTLAGMTRDGLLVKRGTRPGLRYQRATPEAN